MAFVNWTWISGKWRPADGVEPQLFEHYTRTFQVPNGPWDGYFTRFTLPVDSYFDNYKSPGNTRPKGQRDLPTSHHRLKVLVDHYPVIYNRAFNGVRYYDYVSMSTGPQFIAGKSDDVLRVDGTGFYIRADQAAVEAAQTEALLHLKTGKLSLGASIAESRETAEYLVEKGTCVLGMIRAVKSGRYRHFRQAFRRLVGFNDLRGRPLTALSHKEFKDHDRRARAWATAHGVTDMATARWLEYRYAIMPFVSDVENAYETFIDGIKTQNDKERPWLIYSYGKAVHVHNRKFSDNTMNYESSGVSRYKCKIWAKIDNAYLAGTAQVGLSVTQALWEVIPFSFVLDWAVKFGDFLEALDATRGLKFHSGFIRVMSGTDGDEVKLRYRTAPSSFYQTQYPWINCEVQYYSRKELSSFPFPSVIIESPVSPKNIMSAFSLIFQIFAKKRLPGYVANG